MNDIRKERDKALNAVYMAELKGALRKVDLDAKDVDERLKLSPGMTARWLRNEQTMRAPMFAAIAQLTKEGPEELFARATADARAAGLLDHVEVIADDQGADIIEWSDIAGKPAANQEDTMSLPIAASDPSPEETGERGEDLATED